METTLKVKALKHADVRGKELLYIIVGGVIINVGKNTYGEVYNAIVRERKRNGEILESNEAQTTLGFE